MIKCLAPVLLVASTIAPHAEQCPVFTGPKNFACESYGSKQERLNLPLIPMTLEMGLVDGKPSYEIGIAQGKRKVVVGQTIAQRDGGTASASCAVVPGSRGEIPTMILRTFDNKGAPSSENHFSQQGGGAVSLTFGPGGPAGGLQSKLVCRPVFPSKAAPPAGAPALKP